MDTKSKILFLMLGLVTAICFTACCSDDPDYDFVEEQDPGSEFPPEPGYVEVTGVALDRYEINMSRNSTDVITVTISPENASCKDVTWTSSNPSIVKVEDGKITSNPDNDPLLGGGKVTITVTSVDQGIKAECIVNVDNLSGVPYPTYPERQQW